MYYYDLQSFYDLETEKGDRIELLTLVQEKQADTQIGYKGKDRYRSQELRGYAVQVKFSQGAINQISPQYLSAGFKCYLNSTTYSPKMINKDSLLSVNGKLYQMELIEPIMYRGKPIYYCYELNENDMTRTLKVKIIETISLPKKNQCQC